MARTTKETKDKVHEHQKQETPRDRHFLAASSSSSRLLTQEDKARGERSPRPSLPPLLPFLVVKRGGEKEEAALSWSRQQEPFASSPGIFGQIASAPAPTTATQPAGPPTMEKNQIMMHQEDCCGTSSSSSAFALGFLPNHHNEEEGAPYSHPGFDCSEPLDADVLDRLFLGD